MKKLLENKPRLIFWASFYVVILLMLVGVIVGLGSERDQVLVLVGDEKITQGDLNTKIYGINFEGSIEEPSQLSDDESRLLLEELVDNAIYTIKAKEMGIAIDNEELENYLKEKVGTNNLDYYNEDQLEAVRSNALAELIRDKVNERIITLREGEYVEIRFDRYHAGGGSAKDGTEKQKRDMREYAENLATDIHKKISSGEMSFEEAIRIVDEDPVIDIATYFGTWGSQGGKIIDFSHFRNDPTLFSEIEKLKEGELSEPLIRRTLLEGDSGEARESTFVIFRITKVGNGEAQNEFSWLEAQRKLIKIEYRS